MTYTKRQILVDGGVVVGGRRRRRHLPCQRNSRKEDFGKNQTGKRKALEENAASRD
jgi:hypothetical protein